MEAKGPPDKGILKEMLKLNWVSAGGRPPVR